MARKNQKHMLPRSSDGARFTLSRGKFLDGTLRAYYGPGQPPNAGNVRYLDEGAGTGLGFHYAGPADWPRVGQLLRPPQVAWLSHHFPFRSGTGHFEAPRSFLPAVYDVPPFFHEGVLEYAVAYDHTTGAHPTVAEAARLDAAFAEAKARVEALRPGRTFVEVIDWFAEGHLAANAWPHLTCPDVDEGAFFGTHFLHVYCGHFAVDRLQFGAIERQRFTVATDLAGNTPHARSVERIRANAPEFAGFEVRIYDYREVAAGGFVDPLPPYEFAGFSMTGEVALVTWAEFKAWHDEHGDDDPPTDPGAAWLVTRGTDEFGNPVGDGLPANLVYPPDWPILGTDPDGDPVLDTRLPPDGDGGISAYQTERRQALIDAENGRPSDEAEGAHATFLESIAVLNDDGEDHGVALAGDTSELDADALVALIAGHFGFDPETGADLG